MSLKDAGAVVQNNISPDSDFKFQQDVGVYEPLSHMQLQLLLYFNVFIFPVWFLISGSFLYLKFQCLGDLTKFLSVAVLMMSSIIECLRLYLGYVGNLAEQIPELAGFWMLSILLQLPLLTFQLSNPYLHQYAIELTLHGVMWLLLISQLVSGFYALRTASSRAKKYYAMKSKTKPENNLEISADNQGVGRKEK